MTTEKLQEGYQSTGVLDEKGLAYLYQLVRELQDCVIKFNWTNTKHFD